MKKLKLLILCLLLTACASSQDKLPGTWKCQDSPLENKDIYTAYLKLEIGKDLSFSMYDVEAGNPSMTGKMKQNKKTITLKCDHLEDFDPPASWESIKPNETIYYYFKNHKLYLEYDHSTLVFVKSK